MNATRYEVRRFHGQDSYRVGLFETHDAAVEWATDKYGDSFKLDAESHVSGMYPSGAFLEKIVFENPDDAPDGDHPLDYTREKV